MNAPVSFTPKRFRAQATLALHHPTLQAALARAADGFIGKRAKAIAAVPEFEAWRARAARRKDELIAEMDTLLERFAGEVHRQGGEVHFAATAEEARAIVLRLCQQARARVITKGKSMVAEEIGLNAALEEAGFTLVETDLGEYIVQLAKEPPSHIIAPAVHKTKEEIIRLFTHAHGRAPGESVGEIVTEARRVLREKFFAAEVGITGANFLVAETGQTVIVTNEGNGDLTQTLARTHIVVSSIEKVVETLEDVSLFLRLLARSATGQDSETYTTYSCGPRRAGDRDGPEAFHVVIVDNGRRRMRDGPFREMLRCIRCGACMNHCPVYGAIGGHAYGWVYPGPMGSVLTPQFVGLDVAYDLPNACTLNGRCAEVCPVKIPLPQLLRRLRHEQHRAGIRPVLEGRMLQLWRALALRPRWYHLAERLGVRLLAALSGKKQRLRRLPGAWGWTDVRDLPAPAGRTFLELWQAKAGQKGAEAVSSLAQESQSRKTPPSSLANTPAQTTKQTHTPIAIPSSLAERANSDATTLNPRDALIACWCERWQARGGTVERLATRAEIPAAVARWCAEVGAHTPTHASATLLALPWPEGWALTCDAANIDTITAVSEAYAGIAEVGSLMFLSAPEHPTTHRFVPDDQVVVLPAERIVAAFEDGWALLRHELGKGLNDWRDRLPRTVNFVAGPSRTGDVEQTIQLGAHGPRRVHVIVVG